MSADAFAEIKRLYFNATKATIQKDLDRAVTLLKSMSSDDERQRVAVYMDGLSQMRSEWAAAKAPPGSRPGNRGGGKTRPG